MKINILLVDDHRLFLDSLRTSIENKLDYNVIVAKSGNDALKIINSDIKIDVIISDYLMKNINGVELFQEISSKGIKIPFMLLTSHLTPHFVNYIYKLGVNGFVLKNVGLLELKKAISLLLNNEKYFCDEAKNVFFSNQQSNTTVKLNKKEIEVLKLIAKEKTTREIADELYISINTVQTHRRNLMLKTEAKNMIGLYKYAFMNNLI